MAGPTQQELTRQASQAQMAAQQQALHPMASGSPAAPASQSASSSTKQKGITVTTGKLSLLAISLSLMFLGILTFLAGMFFGVWIGGSSAPPSPYQTAAVDHQALGGQYQAAPGTVATAQAQHPGLGSTLKQEGSAIGFGHIASGQAGYAAQSAVSRVRIPGVPSFLTPLVSATQVAVGRQVGYKAQQQVGQQLSSSPQTQSRQAPRSLPADPLAQHQRSAPTTYPTQPHQQQGTSPSFKLTPPPTETTSPHSSVEHGDYSIQLGVYAAKENAQALVNHLQALNYTSEIKDGKAPNGSPLYYVRSGHYKTHAMALDAASQLSSENFPGAVVVQSSQKEAKTQ